MKRIEDLAPDGRYAAPTEDTVPQMIPVVKPKRPVEATSYFEMSQNSIGTDNNSHAFLVGSGGVPPLPPLNYSVDHSGAEPPLGIDISAVEDMLTMPHGGSAAFAPPSPEEIAPAPDEEEPQS